MRAVSLAGTPRRTIVKDEEGGMCCKDSEIIIGWGDVFCKRLVFGAEMWMGDVVLIMSSLGEMCPIRILRFGTDAPKLETGVKLIAE